MSRGLGDVYKRQADISVRSYKAENLKNCLRITITTEDVVRKVVSVLKEEVKKHA